MTPGDINLLKSLAWLAGGFALVATYSWLSGRAKEEEADRARGWRVRRYHGHMPDYEEFDGRRWQRVRFELRSTGPHQGQIIAIPSWDEQRDKVRASRTEILQRLDIPGYNANSHE